MKLKFVQWYMRQLDSHPVITRLCTAGGLLGFADIIAQITQKLRGSPLRYDVERTMRYASYGFWIGGPLQIAWYAKILPKISTKKPARDIAIKIGMESAFATTFFNALYLFLIPVLALKSIEEAQQNVSNHIDKAIKRSWSFWPLFHTLNFALVPLKFQIPFMQACSLLWQSYLNVFTNNQSKEEDRKVRDRNTTPPPQTSIKKRKRMTLQQIMIDNQKRVQI